MDRLLLLQSRIEDFKNATSEKYGRLRLQLVSALHELDKLYSETFQSVSALTHLYIQNSSVTLRGLHEWTQGRDASII